MENRNALLQVNQGVLQMKSAPLDIAIPRNDVLQPKAITDDAALIDALKAIVGRSHIFTDPESTKRFRTGFRFGSGPVVAVLQPGTLVEQWRGLSSSGAANKIVIMQSAHTSLSSRSTPA